MDSLDHEVGSMTQHDSAEAVHDVDIFVAIQIPDTGALGAIGHQRINHLFPHGAESGNCSWICQASAVSLGIFLRLGRAPGVAGDQGLDMLLLVCCYAISGTSLDRLKGTVSFDL